MTITYRFIHNHSSNYCFGNFSKLVWWKWPYTKLNLTYNFVIPVFHCTYHSANKIVFKKTWYVSARLSISSNLRCLHNSSCSFKCYSILCQTFCDVTSCNFLGRLVQCEQKGWDRGRWVGIYTQRVKTAWLCVGLAVKSLSRVIALEKSHFTQNDRVQSYVQEHMYRASWMYSMCTEHA